MTQEFQYSVKLKNTVIHFRKWKVKDKKKFLENKNNPLELKKALVYDCIDNKKIVLNNEEYKFMLAKLRSVSISDPISYTFTCSECATDFDYDANLDDIMTQEFQNVSEVGFGAHVFLLHDIPNRDYYENSIQDINDIESDLIDFIFSVKSYNGDDTLGFEDISDVINNMDVEDFENIIKQYKEIKFKVNNIHEVTCPHCSNKEMYEFDDLPNFFPASWDI